MRWHGGAGGVGDVYTNPAAPEVTPVAWGPSGQSRAVRAVSSAIS